MKAKGTNSISTWAGPEKPAQNHGADGRIRVKAGTRRGYVWAKSPVPRLQGYTVNNATLYLVTDTASAGSITITLTAVNAKWAAKKLTWNNKPVAVKGTAVALTKNPSAGTVWAFNVTEAIQDAADGGAFWGWQITASAGDALTFKSSAAKSGKPWLAVDYVLPPAAPVDLVPEAGAVSVAKPTLSWVYADRTGDSRIDAVRVQVNTTEAGFSAPEWDSGAVPSETPTLNLAATTFPGLNNGDVLYWRALVKGDSGKWSAWSDPAVLTRANKGGLSIIAPAEAPNDFVEEFTPPIVWSLSGRTQRAYQVLVADAAAPGVYLYNSGRVGGTASETTLPQGVLVDDRSYVLTVRVWDTVDRETTPGDVSYVEASRTFAVRLSATVTPPDTLDVGMNPDRPNIVLTWTRDTMPDSWTIERDNQVIAADIDGDDVLVGGSTYAWVDNSAKPGKAHRYVVRAVANGRASLGGPVRIYRPSGSHGIWLGDPAAAVWVRLKGSSLSGLTMTDTETVLTPVNAKRRIRLVSGQQGYAGTIAGVLADNSDGYDVADGLAALTAIKKASKTGVFRLVGADLNIPVEISQLTWTPEDNTSIDNRRYAVSFQAWQVGEFSVLA